MGGYGSNLALFLIEQGYIVKFVNPLYPIQNETAMRGNKRMIVGGAQSVADVLIRKLLYLPEATSSDIHWIITQLVDRRNALVKAQTVFKNQLNMQLNYHYPSYKDFFSEVDGKTAGELPFTLSFGGENGRGITNIPIRS